MYSKEKVKIPEKGDKKDALIFLQKFVDIEKYIRNYFDVNPYLKDKYGYKKDYLSFRDYCNVLLENQILNKDMHEILIQMSLIRNLVVHGKIEEVDNSYIELIEQIKGRLVDRLS